MRKLTFAGGDYVVVENYDGDYAEFLNLAGSPRLGACAVNRALSDGEIGKMVKWVEELDERIDLNTPPLGVESCI